MSGGAKIGLARILAALRNRDEYLPPPLTDRPLPFKAVEAADSAVIRLQGTGASDADKVQAAVSAAAESLREQGAEMERDRIVRTLIANTVAPSSMVLSHEYDRGRTDERRAWIRALGIADGEGL